MNAENTGKKGKKERRHWEIWCREKSDSSVLGSFCFSKEEQMEKVVSVRRYNDTTSLEMHV